MPGYVHAGYYGADRPTAADRSVRPRVAQQPRRLAYVGNDGPRSFARQHGDDEVLELGRRVSASGELGSLHDELQQFLVVVVVERQTTDHLRRQRNAGSVRGPVLDRKRKYLFQFFRPSPRSMHSTPATPCTKDSSSLTAQYTIDSAHRRVSGPCITLQRYC